MVVILDVKVTGSAEIVVAAGSSTDPGIVIADFLGWTVAAALERILAKGYELSFVTDKFFVCTKTTTKRPLKKHQVTLFHPKLRHPRRRTRKA
ncbi:hypothetical protein NZD89_00055 [Alicyclobacillus fastidiosus]|uniref:Uncharacterized protein n=1 Tax=Alicyclobacillus fastidiosus TaxID=392011 RepID=A0ABY6ZGG6_9BACL|nr:hypothetical protein [Alicyclobacillus fastidiosus]WAH41968.1 hypothetical protein NZD89_00055 [Alicyclobacillus fastidiosus]GMA63693.1 hypothetical protein GCM10025859_41330 [Alicyclobacillus fastidiosus]